MPRNRHRHLFIQLMILPTSVVICFYQGGSSGSAGYDWKQLNSIRQASPSYIYSSFSRNYGITQSRIISHPRYTFQAVPDRVSEDDEEEEDQVSTRTLNTARGTILPSLSSTFTSTRDDGGYTTSSSSSSTKATTLQRAGMAGYSITRQPLSWDINQDPVFQVPNLIEDNAYNSNGQETSTSSTRVSDSQWWGEYTTTKDKQRRQQPLNRYPSSSSSTQQSKGDHSDKMQLEDDDDDPILHSTTLDLFQRTLETLDYQ